MSRPGPTSYDVIAYSCHSQPQTHPDRLATIATFAGMTPASPMNCRMLELGCGDGTNVISMAVAAPGSRFVGVDLAPTSIDLARATAAELGLDNVEFHCASIADLPPDLGEFDYVASHGVYSWVPAPVRDALLAASRRHLAENGVAYVSYSVLPGAYVTRMLREMMLFHVRGVTGDEARVRQSMELLKFVFAAGGPGDSVSWKQALDKEIGQLLAGGLAQLRHDELGDVNEPSYWSQFVSHAHRHGLAFLGEADWYSSSDMGLAPAARKVLAQIGADRITREQYLDFCKCRRFRQTLLVRAGTSVEPNPPPSIVRRFYVACTAKLPSLPKPLGTQEAERFEGPSGGAVETDAPIVRAAVRVLAATWPQRLSFDELVAKSVERIAADAPAAPAPGAEDVEFLEHAVLRLFENGLIRFHLTRPRSTFEPPPRPVAPRLARLQARNRGAVTSLFQENVGLEDETARVLVRLLDGTRDRAALLAELCAALAAAPVAAGAAPPTPPTATDLETALASLAWLGLIEG